jgi:hypothetical protein
VRVSVIAGGGISPSCPKLELDFEQTRIMTIIKLQNQKMKTQLAKQFELPTRSDMEPNMVVKFESRVCI